MAETDKAKEKDFDPDETLQFCEYCGATAPMSAKFCKACGREFAIWKSKKSVPMKEESQTEEKLKISEDSVDEVVKRNINVLTRLQEEIEKVVQSVKAFQDLQTGQGSDDSLIVDYLSFLDMARVRTQNIQVYYESLLRTYHRQWVDKFMMNTLYAAPEIIDKMVLEKLMDGADSEEADWSDVKMVYPDLHMESTKLVNRTIPDITMREVETTPDVMAEKRGTSNPVDGSKK
ncbi:MAG: zinc ribbon domain-containing protein [Lachnospiraceae bacterium]|nr:zinc ribbon domain-containing protein [Lachnospiraceae bacterium]